jgi:hypothetical protein
MLPTVVAVFGSLSIDVALEVDVLLLVVMMTGRKTLCGGLFENTTVSFYSASFMRSRRKIEI